MFWQTIINHPMIIRVSLNRLKRICVSISEESDILKVLCLLHNTQWLDCCLRVCWLLYIPGLFAAQPSISRWVRTGRLKHAVRLVLLQHNIVMFSWPVSVPGKARLAGNGRSPCQEVQRCPGALTGQPEGRSRDARPLRCRACQGLRPLPAHGALRTSITRTLNTTILC